MAWRIRQHRNDPLTTTFFRPFQFVKCIIRLVVQEWQDSTPHFVVASNFCSKFLIQKYTGFRSVIALTYTLYLSFFSFHLYMLLFHHIRVCILMLLSVVNFGGQWYIIASSGIVIFLFLLTVSIALSYARLQRLSVTRRWCVKTNEPKIMPFLSTVSPRICFLGPAFIL